MSIKDWGNQMTIWEFILLRFGNLLELHDLLFLLFLVIYLITLMGNIVIITITVLDPALCSPMYFFLRNLSFLEIGYTSSTIPKMLENFLSKDKSISLLGCATQMYFFSLLGITECCLLAALAYDRYVAICHPLHYTTMMSRGVCLQLLAVSWLIGVLVALGQTAFIFTLPYCGPNRINHFFCDLPPLLKLACADTYKNEVAVYTIAVIFIMVPFLLILVSYVHILYTIFKIPSAAGRSKTFSTCSSHLIVVTLFYGTAIVTYLRPKSRYSRDTDKLLSLFYTVVCPMLNPLIYSLRNKEVKKALRRVMARKIFI
ncbi:olfactory receptor 10A4-like isoform X2 [Chelonoidis abingdonii]|uniref:olfactory receptor 10A4-like isoform X2 n=1 Tax=Chelonoidis abingdonii TaxID=106734 RepID=UPI0013F24EA7|nr:olfactory receptor 10A4-like [Chelonoidis abingdonii]